MNQGDRQKYLSRRDQLVEQVIRRQTTIADGAEGVIEIQTPTAANVFLKGIGYDYFGTAIHKLQDSNRTLHKGSNQIGSIALPQQWSVPYYMNGKIQLFITNNTGASQDYTAVFILHTDVLIDLESQGTLVAVPVGGGVGSVSDVRIYGQDTGGTDHVCITDGGGNLVVQLEAAPTIEIGDVGMMVMIGAVSTLVTGVTVGAVTSEDVNLNMVSGALVAAGNPLFTQLSDGTNVVGTANPLNVMIGDGTTQAAVTAGLTALKVDLAGTNGAALGPANPISVELTDGTNFISPLNPLSVTSVVPSTLLAGTASSVADAAIVLGVSTACKEVTVQADYANTTVMYVGNATSQTIELYAGDSVDIKIDDLDTIYIRRTIGGADVTANYIGA